MWAELTGVHLTGHAELMTAGERLDEVMAALHAKYEGFRTPRPQMPERTRAHYESGTATIEIAPDDRILSWDNARL